MVILDCPALSKDRTIRRKVSANSMQDSVSVKKNNIIEITLDAFLWDCPNRISDKRWIKEHQRIKGTDESFPIVGSTIDTLDATQSASFWNLDPDPTSSQRLFFFFRLAASKQKEHRLWE